MNTITLYDGSMKQVANGVKLLAQVPRHEKGACRVCGEVVQKSRPNQAQCGKEECRMAFDTFQRKQARHAAAPNTAPTKPPANQGDPSAPLRAGEIARFRSIVRKTGHRLGDRVHSSGGYQVHLSNGEVTLVRYAEARDFEKLPALLARRNGKGQSAQPVVVPPQTEPTPPARPVSPVAPKLAMARVMVAADAVRASKLNLEAALSALDAARLALQSFETTLEAASVEAVHEGCTAEEVESAIAEVWSV